MTLTDVAEDDRWPGLSTRLQSNLQKNAQASQVELVAAAAPLDWEACVAPDYVPTETYARLLGSDLAYDERSRLVRAAWLAAAHAATSHCGSPPACARLLSGPERRVTDDRQPRSGCGGAPVPAQRRRYRRLWPGRRSIEALVAAVTKHLAPGGQACLVNVRNRDGPPAAASAAFVEQLQRSNEGEVVVEEAALVNNYEKTDLFILTFTKRMDE